MHIRWLLALVLVFFLGPSVPVLAHPNAQACAVSEVYQEP